MTNAIAIAQGGSNNVTMRNRIINGAMVVNQRGTGSSTSSTNGTYPADRTKWYTGTSGTGTVGANMGSVTPPAGFTNYIGYTQGGSATTISTSSYFAFFQAIEGYNIADWGWGTSNPKSVTVSFWVYSSLTGTFSASLRNSAHTYGYPFNYTISSANTWTQVSAVVTGPTVGVWDSTNGSGAELYISYGTGSDFTGTANTWNAGNIAAVTGATNLVATANAYLYVTGIQIEVGTTASPFEYRQYGTELALCQRYYYKTKATSSATFFGAAYNYSTAQTLGFVKFAVTMRTTPTALEQTGTASDYGVLLAGSGTTSVSVPTFDGAGVEGASVQYNVSGVTAAQGCVIRGLNSNAYLAWSAEL